MEDSKALVNIGKEWSTEGNLPPPNCFEEFKKKNLMPLHTQELSMLTFASFVLNCWINTIRHSEWAE